MKKTILFQGGVIMILLHFFFLPLFSQSFTGPYDQVTGKFYIRTYFVFVENASTGTWTANLGNAELTRRTTIALNNLNKAYNPEPSHIYFILAAAPDGKCFQVANVEQNFIGGLTVNIRPDNGVAQGSVGTVPDNRLWVEGSENGVPASSLPVLIHEVGHCLGLYHTFATTCDEQTTVCPDGSGVFYPGCNCCGDLVCGTVINPVTNDDFIIVNDDCSVSTSHPSISSTIFKNFMAYTTPKRCQDRFEPEQVLRMRYFLKYHPEVQNFQINQQFVVPPGTTTWNSASTFEQNIEVPAGATLILNAVVNMASGTYIFVKKSGKLVINSTITASCGMWGGIEVEGTQNADQTTTNAGLVQLNGSGKVEHAVHGIGAVEFDAEDNKGGGIIEARGRLENCSIGLEFGSHTFVNNGVLQPNKSFVNASIFIVNDNYRGSSKPTLIKMEGISGLKISSSFLFDNRIQGCGGRADRANGIVAKDAGFILQGTVWLRYFDFGVRSSSLKILNGGYSITGSSFARCYTGVHSAFPEAFRITGSTFNIDRKNECPAQPNEPFIGLELLGQQSNFDVSNNTFQSIDNEEEEILVGTLARNLGEAENLIHLNKYFDLDIGDLAQGINAASSTRGLMYECNEYSGSINSHIYISGTGIRNPQGRFDQFLPGNVATGNTFENANFDIWNTGNQFTYYHLNVPIQTPQVAVNVDVEPTPFANGDCPVPNDDGCVECPESVKTDFGEAKSSWLAKKITLSTTTDPAQKTILEGEIAVHRAEMDRIGSKIVQFYALDTLGIKIDSLFEWYKNLQSYESDQSIARHYFFKKGFQSYDNWLLQIPIRNQLTAQQADELDKIKQVLAIIRPSLENGESLNHLPETVLDSLNLWVSDCSEPGYLAKEVLFRNDRETWSYCDDLELGEKPAKSGSVSPNKPGFEIFPNPSRGLLEIRCPDGLAPHQFCLFDLTGKMMVNQKIAQSATVDLKGIPSGFYTVVIQSNNRIHFRSKLVVAH